MQLNTCSISVDGAQTFPKVLYPVKAWIRGSLNGLPLPALWRLYVYCVRKFGATFGMYIIYSHDPCAQKVVRKQPASDRYRYLWLRLNLQDKA